MKLRASSPQKIQVTCSACGHTQQEYAAAVSTSCRACGHRIPIQVDAGKKPAAKIKLHVKRREISCRHCGHLMVIPTEAQSWQCPACSNYLDFKNHVIDRETSAPILTYGSITIGPRGVFGGSKADCATADIAGRAVGRVISQSTVTLSGQARLSAGAEGKILEVIPDAKVESSANLDFETIRIQGRLRAKDLRAERVEVLSGGQLEADSIRIRTLHVAPGGRLQARIETVASTVDGNNGA